MPPLSRPKRLPKAKSNRNHSASRLPCGRFFYAFSVDCPCTQPAFRSRPAFAPETAVPAVDSAAEVWYTVRMKHAAELDKKRTHTDKGRIRAATALGCIALTACVSVWIAHAFNAVAAVRSFAILFYPTAVVIATGCWLSAAELLRNRYISAGAALALNGIALVLLLAYIILQAATGPVYILPFASPF